MLVTRVRLPACACFPKCRWQPNQVSNRFVIFPQMRPVRIELTTLGLWDPRATNCAIAALKNCQLSDFMKPCAQTKPKQVVVRLQNTMQIHSSFNRVLVSVIDCLVHRQGSRSRCRKCWAQFQEQCLKGMWTWWKHIEKSFLWWWTVNCALQHQCKTENCIQNPHRSSLFQHDQMQIALLPYPYLCFPCHLVSWEFTIAAPLAYQTIKTSCGPVPNLMPWASNHQPCKFIAVGLMQSFCAPIFLIVKRVWSSGYDVSLTRWRSPVRSWVPVCVRWNALPSQCCVHPIDLQDKSFFACWTAQATKNFLHVADAASVPQLRKY